LFLQNIFHREQDDDFVAALEERFDLLQRIRSEIKRQKKPFEIILCFVENFSLTPGLSRVRKGREEKNRLNGFFLGAFVVHRVKTRR